MRKSRMLSLAASLGLAGALAGVLPADAAADRPHVVVKGGVTQPTFSYQDAIRQRVYVPVSVDTDHDGRPDRVAVDVTRPKETDAGLKVASILEGSPYFSGLVDTPYHPVDVTDRPRLAPWSPPTGPIPAPSSAFSYYDNYFVSRGYAFLAAATLGTGDSEGCPGATSPAETTAMKTVVQWLTGKAKAYDANGHEIRADWSTHSVAMAGKSYDGTLPLATAGTGVDGLKTIVSLSAVANWYDYYRSNGGVVAPDGYQGEDADLHAKVVLTRKNPVVCTSTMHRLERGMDRVSGDYNRFWDERNFAKDVGRFKASVLAAGGLNDWNVKPSEFLSLWQALGRAGVPRKLWIHQGKHDDPIDVRQQAWLDTLDHWFAHWLYGVDNGVMSQPKVDLERSPGQWTTATDWPDPAARTTTFHLGGGQPGMLGDERAAGEQSFVDAPARTADQLTAQPDQADPNRLIYLTPKLDKAVRLSGTPEVKVRASVNGRSPYLTALLVDYGTDTRFADFVMTGEQSCFGDGIPTDTGCRPTKKYVLKSTPYQIVTRGWMDVRNRDSAARTEAVRPGKAYTFDWKLVPYDYVFKPGHRIGLVVLSTDHDYTLRYPAGTQVSVRAGESDLRLPISGG